MAHPSLKLALHAHRPARVVGLGQLCHPKFVELIGHVGGYDAVWFDQEHVGLTIPQIEEASRAARAAGIASFVRLTATDYATVMRALEAGSGGIMAAMVRQIDEVHDLVRWTRFHPIGERGINGTGVDAHYGQLPLADYLREANERIVLGVQIEHADAVDIVEQIAAVEHVDFLFIGPADLSQSLGIPGEWEHPRLWAAIERVAAACRAAGRVWGILPLGPAHARRCRDLGCRLFSIGLDMWILARGVQAFKREYADLFED